MDRDDRLRPLPGLRTSRCNRVATHVHRGNAMSKIEWCDITKDSKVVDGCSPKSRGVGRQQDVPAMVEQHAEDGTRSGVRPGVKRDLVKIGKTRDGLMRGIYNGRVALNPERLRNALEKIPRNGGMRYPRDPETGKADRSKPKEPRGKVVFWNSSSDTFHERLSFSKIMAQFAVMAARQDLRFLVLTKRPEHAYETLAYFKTRAFDEDRCGIASALRQSYRHATGADMAPRWAAQIPDTWPLPNVALGVSAEDQKHWDERVPLLLEMKERGDAARTFVSAEPMLGPIVPDIMDGSWWDAEGANCYNPFTGTAWWSRGDHGLSGGPVLDQVIIGAESGPGARPCKLEWIQDLAGAVLDAQDACTDCGGVGGWQAAPTDMFQVAWQECPKCRGEGTTGPRLFIKQADVCPECAGQGVTWGAGRWFKAICEACNGTTRAGKVRKNCPEIYIPEIGGGTRSWAQRMEGF